MTHKGTLLGTFIKKTEILSFLEYLKNTFHMNMERVFVYAVDGNDTEYLVSFKAPEEKKNARFNNASVLHDKDSLIILTGGELHINKLTKIEDKCLLLA